MDNFLLALLKMLRADSAAIATAEDLQEFSNATRCALLEIQKTVLDTREELHHLRQSIPRQLFHAIGDMKMALNAEVAKLSAKADELGSKLDAAMARDAVQAQLVVDLRAQIEALKSTVVALPVDTTEAEAAIDAVIAKMDAAGTKLDSLDAAPVAVEPAPVPVEPTPAEPVVEPTPAPAEPAPVVEAPVETAPEAPVDGAPTADAPASTDPATKIDANT